MNRPVSVLGAILLLAGGACSSTVPPPAGGCPKVAVLGDLAELVRFRAGGGRDLTDVEFSAKFSSFAFGCRYEKDSVTVEIDVEIDAGRGERPLASACRVAATASRAAQNSGSRAREVACPARWMERLARVMAARLTPDRFPASGP